MGIQSFNADEMLSVIKKYLVTGKVLQREFVKKLSVFPKYTHNVNSVKSCIQFANNGA